MTRQWDIEERIPHFTLVEEYLPPLGNNEPQQSCRMKREGLRALTPLSSSHITPYGLFRLDLSERMPIEETLPA